MPRGGAKPGERRGGRQKGTPNKRNQGIRAAEEEAKARLEAEEKSRQGSAPDENIPTFDSLALKRRVATMLFSLVINEHNKRMRGEDWDKKWLQSALEAVDRALNGLLPYEHRRLATLEPAMETVVKPDGSVHVTISRTDSEL